MKFKNSIKKIYNDFMDILKRPLMRILPGQLAFYFLMSFIPIFAMVVLISSKVINDYDLLVVMQGFIPVSLYDLVSSAVSSASNYSNIWLLFVFYFILASNGPLSIIRTSNLLYEIEDPKWFQSRVKALVMTILLVLLLLFMIIIPTLGDTIIGIIYKYANLPEYLLNYTFIYQFLKIVVSFIFIYFIIKIIYIIAPDKRIKGKTTSAGALFTTIFWIIATEVFSFYITYVANYNLLYGNFANILIILFWVYLLAYLFVVGMVINNNNYNKLKKNK